MSAVTPFPSEPRPILEVRQLSQTYKLARSTLVGPRPTLKVLEGIDFSVKPGEAVGLVGESGSGKTTLTRMLTGVEKPMVGHVLYNGVDVWAGSAE